MKSKKVFFQIFILIGVVAIFSFGFYIGQLQKPEPPISGVINQTLEKPEGVDFSLFWKAWRILEKKFVEPERLDYQKMIYGAVSGMVKSLKDPYTVFLPPEDTKIFTEDVSGVFEGVGMEIGIRKGELTVIAPLEGTPAQKAGLRAGDKIIKVDDTYTRDLTIEEAVKLIRGKKGTKVTLTIFREGWHTAKDFEITRGVIEIPCLKWKLLSSAGQPDGKKDIAYLKLYQFSEKASFDFKKAAVEILNSSAEKIILDLRNNPGGYLEVAQDIAGWFLKRGEVVVIEDFGEGKERKEYKAKGNAKLLPYPLVILINQGSASGSEILAGALRDNRGVKLIGEKSFGKGSVQELERLRDGSSLKITIAKWLTPKGELIADKGLEPDVKIEMTEEDYKEERDPQLDKAIEVIREMK